MNAMVDGLHRNRRNSVGLLTDGPATGFSSHGCQNTDGPVIVPSAPVGSLWRFSSCATPRLSLRR